MWNTLPSACASAVGCAFVGCSERSLSSRRHHGPSFLASITGSTRCRARPPSRAECVPARSFARSPVGRSGRGAAAIRRRFRDLPRQSAIDVQVVVGHAGGVEPLLERLAAVVPARAIATRPTASTASSTLSTTKPVTPSSIDLGHRAAAQGDDRRAARHRLDHHQAERLRPVDREQQGVGVAEEVVLRRAADLADELDQGATRASSGSIVCS